MRRARNTRWPARACRDAWRAADHDVGERLVVAQQHVEAWPEALDQVVFEEQRLGFAVGDGEFHGSRRRDHADQARGQPGRLRIGGDAAAQRARFSDVQNLAVGRDHAVDARLARQGPHEVRDDPHSVGERTFAGRQVDVGFFGHLGRGKWPCPDVCTSQSAACGEVCAEAASRTAVTPESLY